MKRRAGELLFSDNELKAWSVIEKAETVIITSHIHPDGDAIGSSLAMLRYCRSLGRQVSVIIDDEIPEIYEYLADVHEIGKPDAGQKLKADLLIILDTNPRRIGRVSTGEYKSILNIDHHSVNPKEEDYHIIREYPSAAELLFRIFVSIDYVIDSETARCLYTGLITDTVFFKAPSIGSDTFEVAAALVRLGVNSGQIAACLEAKKFDETKLISMALSEIKQYRDGKVVGVALSEEYDELELTDVIIDTIRYIRGVKIAFLLKHEKDGGYRVRMRSQSIDVSEFAKENGGGGHPDAAGFTIDNDNGEEAERIFIGGIEKWLGRYFG